ncbi:MAG: FAD-binding oxidoreductase, partial [Acidimicrobiia bacterium]|nr:FAD-binding oxidoreductase [Acidimicrobiia bacterium]
MNGRALVIGGGIAGVSAAYALAPHFDVILLERESTLAYHTTGRSAAQYIENYGVPAVRALTRASHGFLSDPPDDLADHPLLSPCAVMMIARPDQTQQLEAALIAEGGGAEMKRLEPKDALELCPILRPEYLGGALLEEDGADIDVAALHQAFVRGIRKHGGEIRTDAGVSSLEATTGGWRAASSGDVVEADLVINAGGAWGDQIAGLAGIPPVGLVPKRRTAFMVTAPAGLEDSPMIVDIDEQFYFKRDGQQILCSPAEEVPSEPCDARPREIDIAIAIDRINDATT